jgi:hypothetical protein
MPPRLIISVIKVGFIRGAAYYVYSGKNTIVYIGALIGPRAFTLMSVLRYFQATISASLPSF